MSSAINLFYLYDPWVMHVIRMSFVMGIVAFGYLFYLWKTQKIDGIKVPMDSFIAIFALIVLSIIPLLINGTKELGVLIMYVKTLLLFSFGVMIYNAFYRTANSQGQCVRDLERGVIAQAIMGLLALTGISLFVDIALGTNTSAILPRFAGSEQEYRLYNITSSAFFQLSAFFVVLLHFWLAYNEKTNRQQGIFLLLILFIGVMSGRTFFVLSALSILLYFKWRYVPYLIVFVAIVLGLAIYLPDNRYVEHALEPVINILSRVMYNVGDWGDTDFSQISSSTDTLMQKHLFMPELKQLLMGDGYYYTPDFRYYGGSDSGFIRQALYGGVGYILVCFLFTAYFVKRIADNWFEGSWKFTLSLLLILSVLNIKADTYAFPGIMLVLLMFLSLFGSHGKMLVLFKQSEAKNV
ncbi:hypothetical protein [Conservatibacter flavescens]|uniref:Uncharacterized protein n=1 Tax=Conservatibacter flavescens TaxID=28161 RepID=A0A2M8S2A7_9PAST|nr:hypothetical protein [Conservatibacter flavescens]PJG85236.1 hypothetical protein CVP05_08185 [Conservatibacter flavescens]